MRLISSFLCGLLFALGLGISGMTRPDKVIGFLDVAGNWDPTLAFVMAGALAVVLPAFFWILRQPAPLLGGDFALPQKHKMEGRLLGGAALFGAGWGLSGYCPGPAIVSLVTLHGSVIAFVLAMVGGLVLGTRLHR